MNDNQQLPTFLRRLQAKCKQRRIAYVLISPRGRLAKITVEADVSQSEEWLLDAYAPNHYSPPRMKGLLKAGWSLCNWHVIYPEARV